MLAWRAAAAARLAGGLLRASGRAPAPVRGARRAAAAGPAAAAADDAAAAAGAPFTVTTPLFYVNAPPHMGSAYPTVAADALARFQRARGARVAFVTGVDEHGEKIAAAAAARGLAPAAHCDDVVASYKSLWAALDVSYDSFVRTTERKHAALVGAVLERAWARGDIYKAAYEGRYCVECEEYKDEAEMEGPERLCPTHRRPCLPRAEENYFFALSKYQAFLEKLLESRPDFVAPEARRNEVLGWVRAGLRDFSISRAAAPWGVPVPRDPSQTVYVWFDALNGYLSGLYGAGAAEEAAAGAAAPADLAARGWPAAVHVIGKDILRFHAIYWPAMLASAGLPPPARVFGHGFLTKDGLKMGKALGNVLDPAALVARYGADAVRFYLLREVAFGQDGDFSEERFRAVVNAGLANDVGNLLNRTLNLLAKNCGGALPVGADAAAPEAHPLRVAAGAAAAGAAEGYAAMRFHEALEAALALSAAGNRYIDEVAPWTAFKKGGDADKAAAGAALVAVLEAVRVTAVLLAPATPAFSARVFTQLGLPAAEGGPAWAEAAWGGLQAGHAPAPPAPIFARLEGEWLLEPPAEGAAEAAAAEKKAARQRQRAKAEA
jgi:methionyl-tRNA synthetase